MEMVEIRWEKAVSKRVKMAMEIGMNWVH